MSALEMIFRSLVVCACIRDLFLLMIYTFDASYALDIRFV